MKILYFYKKTPKKRFWRYNTCNKPEFTQKTLDKFSFVLYNEFDIIMKVYVNSKIVARLSRKAIGTL